MTTDSKECVITGSIAGYILSVSDFTYGSIKIGDSISGPAIADGTVIIGEF